MICKRCQRLLRRGEALRSGICEACVHTRGLDQSKEQNASGDRSYQWKCSLCQNYVSNVHGGSESGRQKDNNTLMKAVSSMSEKLELVNKFQLPKLNSDIARIKSITDRIAEQNEHILRKIDEMEAKSKNEKQAVNTYSRYRKISLNLGPKLKNMSKNRDDLPITVSEKTVRYRPRRRSYLLHRIFKILNRKMNKTKSPRKQ